MSILSSQEFARRIEEKLKKYKFDWSYGIAERNARRFGGIFGQIRDFPASRSKRSFPWGGRRGSRYNARQRE